MARTRRTLVAATVALAIFGPASVILDGSRLATAQIGAVPEQDGAAGATLFRAKGCAACHTAKGVGEAAGSGLRPIPPSRSSFELAAAMWNHLPDMSRRIWTAGAERPYLTPDQMQALLAFLSGARSEATLDETGDSRRGQRLVAAKGCLACHSLAGAPGPRAGSLDRLWHLVDSPWIVMAAMWNHTFLMAIETEERRVSWPQLSAAEMADLVTFLRTGPAGP